MNVCDSVARYLSDITFIDEGNPDTVQVCSAAALLSDDLSRGDCLQGLINWKKRQMLSDVIENIAVMQQMQYERAPVASLFA